MTLNADRLKRSRSHAPHVRQRAVSFADYDPSPASSAGGSVNESLIGTRLTMDRRTGRYIHFKWRASDANPSLSTEAIPTNGTGSDQARVSPIQLGRTAP